MEFTLKSAKIVESMKDLTEHEIKLFRQYLEEEVSETVEDFFEGGDLMSDDFRVMYWDWRGQTVIDMNGWPGDNEAILFSVEYFTFFQGLFTTLNAAEIPYEKVVLHKPIRAEIAYNITGLNLPDLEDL